jgi:hypothetical protein
MHQLDINGFCRRLIAVLALVGAVRFTTARGVTRQSYQGLLFERMHNSVKSLSQRGPTPEDRFLRLCRQHKLKPVLVDGEYGLGLALDRHGRPFVNAGPQTKNRRGIGLGEGKGITGDATRATEFSLLTIALSIEVYRRLSRRSCCITIYPSFHNWLEVMEEALRFRELWV